VADALPPTATTFVGAPGTVTGEPTVTVALAVTLPLEPEAVSVYVVVAVGVTAMLVPVTVPTPWLMERDVASETDHVRVEEPPTAMVAGVAVNDAIAAEGLPLLQPAAKKASETRDAVTAQYFLDVDMCSPSRPRAPVDPD
jgi:hypothetical protein